MNNRGLAWQNQLAALSDALRVRLLAVLDQQELTVSELCEVLQLPQSTVSRHLKALSDAGLVTSRREATSRFYARAQDDASSWTTQLWTLVRTQAQRSVAAAQDDRRLSGVLARRRRRSEAFFSSSAGQWDRLREELFGAASHLRGLLGWLDERWVVGDLGCGTGQVSEALAPFVARVVAVDASTEMLAAARDRLAPQSNIDLRTGALEHLPLGDAALDAACMMLVLHHVPDPAKALAEAGRVLRPAGRLVVVDMLPHDRAEYSQTMGHVWLGFSERQMGRFLADAGFEGVRWHLLPSDALARGPALFAAAARRTGVAAPSARSNS